MILSAQQIRQACKFAGLVSPFHERTVHNGMTFGLGSAGYDIRVAEDVCIMDGRLVLASSIEHFDMPPDILGQVCDKSTWARRGLFVQNTIIEPGWRGHLTLELTYHPVGADSKLTISLSNRIDAKRGDPIAQIIFMRLEEATDQPYKGKYQDQPAGPQEPIEEKA